MLAALLLPATALAGTTTAAVGGATLTVTGDAAANTVELGTGTQGGQPQITVRDTAGTTAAGAGCTETGGTVSCPAAGVTGVSIDLLAAADSLTTGALALPITAQGGADDDTLTGGAGSDALRGGPGNDLIDGGPGVVADLLDGEAGINTVDYVARTEQLTINLADAGTDGAPGEGDTVANFRGIRGGGGDDTLRLAPAPDTEVPLDARGIDGNGGNDTLIGIDGFERLDGGPGNDTLSGFAANDRLIGGPGNDTIAGGNGDDRIFGDDGDDAIDGGIGNDQIEAGNGADTVDGGGWNDTIYGRAGADTIRGGDGVDTVPYDDRANAVSVTLGSGPGDDGNEVDGPPGQRDTLAADVEDVRGTEQADTLIGSDGPNGFIAGGGNDVLRGLGGDDSFDGGGGNDVLDGGPGLDSATWFSYFYGATITLDGVANDGFQGLQDEDRDNAMVERVIGGNQGDRFTGSDADEVFEGGGGNDVITAGGGNDTINGSFGADTIDAGAGNDLIGTSDDPAVPCLDCYDNARDMVEGGPGDDTFPAGNDTLGGDVLGGGPGLDTIDYGVEYRAVRIAQDGVANDGVTARESANVGGMEIIRGSYGGADVLSAEGGALQLEGLGGNDTLTGAGGDERLLGGDGADTLDGGDGDDILDGGAGKDVVKGSGGTDTATYASRATAVTVTLDGVANDGTPARPAPPSPPVPAEQDNVDTEVVLGTPADDTLTGSAGPDVLRGLAGADTLDGGAGNDTVDGGLGADALRSGTGIDRLDAADGEADTLTCDTREGKTVTADPGLDTVDTCVDPASLAGGGGAGGGFTFLPLPTIEAAAPLATPAAGAAPPARTAGASDRPAAALARALKLRRSATLRTPTSALALATASCQAIVRCTVRAVLLRGRRAVGKGTVAGTGPVAVRAYLLTAGRRALRAGRKVRMSMELTITEGGSQATVRGNLTVTSKGKG